MFIFRSRSISHPNIILIPNKPIAFLHLGLLIIILMPAPLLATDMYTAAYVKGHENSLEKYILEMIGIRLKSELGIQLRYRGATIARNLLLMKDGANDLMAFLKKNPKRNAYLHYIEPPVFNMNVTFIVRKGEHTSIQKYEDLYGLRIGTFRGAQFFPRFNEDKLLNKSYRISLQQDIYKLLLNRLDAVIVSEHMSSYQIMKLDLQDKVEFSDYAYREWNPIYITLSKNAPIMKRFDVIEPVIRNMLESGEIRTAIEQFYMQLGIPASNL